LCVAFQYASAVYFHKVRHLVLVSFRFTFVFSIVRGQVLLADSEQLARAGRAIFGFPIAEEFRRDTWSRILAVDSEYCMLSFAQFECKHGLLSSMLS